MLTLITGVFEPFRNFRKFCRTSQDRAFVWKSHRELLVWEHKLGRAQSQEINKAG